MSDRGDVPSSASVGAPAGDAPSAGAVMTGGIEHLDFGVRNTLLYYKDLKATLDLTPGSGVAPAAVRRLLGSEPVPVSELFDTDREAMRGATKRVRSISYRARRDVDKGSPGTLCLAWGLATWDNGRPAVPAAPVVLRQASVTRHGGTAEDFDLGLSGPWIVNTTLLRLLEVDFAVDVERDALGDLVDELGRHGDPQALFERMTKMASDVPGFSIAPRVVLSPIPRVAMTVDREVRRTAPQDPVPPAPDATAEALERDPPAPYPDPIVRGAGSMAEDVVIPISDAHRTVVADRPEETAGDLATEAATDAVIAEITRALRGDNWPAALIEHADSGLRVRDGAELLRRWELSGEQRPGVWRWDATHFALWGLTAAPPVGDPAILSVARWDERRHHPVLMAWHTVAEHRYRRHRHRGRGRSALLAKRPAVPRGIDEALWGLPVDLLVEWAAWVFRQWPGAPFELVLPAGTPELVSPWYERARPVAELAVKTWVPFALVDDDLGKAAHRWVKQLTHACDGGGAPLATWFERSMEIATSALALRVGAPVVPGAARGRRTKRGAPVTHAEHAI